MPPSHLGVVKNWKGLNFELLLMVNNAVSYHLHNHVQLTLIFFQVQQNIVGLASYRLTLLAKQVNIWFYRACCSFELSSEIIVVKCFLVCSCLASLHVM